MYNIPPYSPSVTLFSDSGERYTYPSLKEALKVLGFAWIQANVGSHFRVFQYMRWNHACSFVSPEEWQGGTPVYSTYRFIMRDSLGAPLVAGSFWPLLKRKVTRRWSRNSYGHVWNGEGPVPNTGRDSTGSMFRLPKTQCERKQAALVLFEEGEVAPRAKRAASKLPHAWWDDWIAGREDRSWKNYRKQQWKPNRNSSEGT